MKSSTIIGIVLALIVLAGVAWFATRPAAAPNQESSEQGGPAEEGTAGVTVTNVTTTTTTSEESGTPAPQSFTVNGNDETADRKTITVPAGTEVTITFGADAGSTYHGGLDFRSSVVNTGTIAPGATKSVTFTADHSFSFTPYWPATNIAKPYTIDIVVE